MGYNIKIPYTNITVNMDITADTKKCFGSRQNYGGIIHFQYIRNLSEHFNDPSDFIVEQIYYLLCNLGINSKQFK